MQRAHLSEVGLKRLYHAFGKHRYAVLRPLAVANQDLPVGEVRVFHAQHQAFLQAQPRAVEQACHHPGDAIELREQFSHLGRGEHDRDPHRAFRPHQIVEPGQVALEHRLVEKEKSGERLVLRRGRDVALGRKPTEERRDLRGAHLGRMALVVMQDEVADPEPVGFLRAPAVVTRADRRTNPIDQAG